MIDIIESAFAPSQIDQVFDRSDEIFVGEDPLGRINVDPEFLIDLVTADPPEVVFLWIKEEPFQQSTRVGDSRWIARAKAAVNVLERFFLIVRRIFSKRFHDGVIVSNVDHCHLVNFKRHNLADGRQGERFKRTRHRYIAVADLRSQHFGGELLFVEFLAQLQGLDVVKKLDDVFVRSVAEGAQECGGKKLPAPLASVEINIKEVSRIKLDLNP